MILLMTALTSRML